VTIPYGIRPETSSVTEEPARDPVARPACVVATFPPRCHNDRVMTHIRPRFLGAIGLLCLPAICGCGSTSPPPPEASATHESTPPASTDASSDGLDREALPDISVAEQRLQVGEPTTAPGVEVVRKYTQMFYSGDLDQLRESFSAEMKEEFPPERLQVMRDRVRMNLGEEVEIVGEDSQAKDDYRGFVRWARFSKHDGLVEVQWILREDDTIAGFQIREARPEGP
jgi:hypothetical protein